MQTELTKWVCMTALLLVVASQGLAASYPAVFRLAGGAGAACVFLSIAPFAISASARKPLFSIPSAADRNRA